MTNHSKLAHGKRKLVQVDKVVANINAPLLHVTESELTKESKSDTEKYNLELKARDLDHLVAYMKKNWKLQTVIESCKF